MKPLLALVSLAVGMPGCAERVPLETPRPPGNYPRITRMVAHPMVIHRGEKIILHWDTANAGNVTIEQAIDPESDIRAEFQAIGTFPASGTLELYPRQSTTYIVSCGNEVIGCSSAGVHVTVK